MIGARALYLSEIRHSRDALARLQAHLTPLEARRQIEGWARHDPRVCLLEDTGAEDRDRIVGMAICTCAARLRDATELARQLALDPEAGVVRAFIQLAPGYRGRGLSRRLSELTDRDAAAQGYSYRLVYGFQTPQIHAWALKIAPVRDTGLFDRAGHPVGITDLVPEEP